MSYYTTQLRYICEHYAGYDESVGLSQLDDVVAKAIPKLFDFDFPLFDEEYREVLCTKIIHHFYFREIGAETVGQWKLWLRRTLNEIMPYYNLLYKSAAIEYNPLYNIDVTNEYERSVKGDSEAHSDSKGNSGLVSKYSDTPQGALTGLMDDEYLTNATVNSENATSSDSTKGNSNTLEKYIAKRTGSDGGTSFATRINEWRSTFMNIDMMIIKDLEPLFFGLFN